MMAYSFIDFNSKNNLNLSQVEYLMKYIKSHDTKKFLSYKKFNRFN